MLSFTDRLVYTIPSKLPDDLISSMIKYVEEMKYEDASIGGIVPMSSNNEPYRSSRVAWINWDEWIAGIIHNIMISANKEYFKYDLTHFQTHIQATIYNGSNKDFYTWHVDSGAGAMKREDGVVTERKLSCSLILSDPEEYTGGELQFHYYKNFFISTKPKKGDALIFPAWMPHRVRPVKSGKRISLVAWMNGPCFK